MMRAAAGVLALVIAWTLTGCGETDTVYTFGDPATTGRDLAIEYAQ